MTKQRKTYGVPWLMLMAVVPIQISALVRGGDTADISSWIFILVIDSVMVALVYGAAALRRRGDGEEHRRP